MLENLVNRTFCSMQGTTSRSADIAYSVRSVGSSWTEKAVEKESRMTGVNRVCPGIDHESPQYWRSWRARDLSTEENNVH